MHVADGTEAIRQCCFQSSICILKFVYYFIYLDHLYPALQPKRLAECLIYNQSKQANSCPQVYNLENNSNNTTHKGQGQGREEETNKLRHLFSNSGSYNDQLSAVQGQEMPDRGGPPGKPMK